MSIYDDPSFHEEFVYLEQEGEEFGRPTVEIDPDVTGVRAAAYPEDMPDELFGDDGELLFDEDGGHDEWT